MRVKPGGTCTYLSNTQRIKNIGMNVLSSVSPYVSGTVFVMFDSNNVHPFYVQCYSAIYVKIYTFVMVSLTHSWVGEY